MPIRFTHLVSLFELDDHRKQNTINYSGKYFNYSAVQQILLQLLILKFHLYSGERKSNNDSIHCKTLDLILI